MKPESRTPSHRFRARCASAPGGHYLYNFYMHIQSFKVFSNLAETSSFSKAAQMNGITQSAVSQQVCALERRFRVKLIERGRKNFSLTPEGRALLQARVTKSWIFLGMWRAGFTIFRIS
jgi:hypothetical protein